MALDRLAAWYHDQLCARKRSYPNKQKARQVAALSSKRTGEVIEAYKCPYGGHWHIGHNRYKKEKHGS